MHQSDEQLMTLVKSGNLQKASLLFDRYHVLIYNYFLRRIMDRQLSEDLMQVVFERLIRYRNSFVDGHNFRSWLFTIARNVAIDESRKRKLTFMDEDQAMTIADHENEGSRDRKNTLLQAISLLPEQDGEIIRLTKIHGFKNKEVGELLNLTESNVKVKIHRAMKDLKNILINQLDYEY